MKAMINKLLSFGNGIHGEFFNEVATELTRLDSHNEGLQRKCFAIKESLEPIQALEMAINDLSIPDQPPIDWKLKTMQVLDKVGADEGIWFEPWPGVTEEEEKEIKKDYKSYKIGDRPLWQSCESHNFPETS